MNDDKEKDPHPEQAADDNRGPGQTTPSRGYGRQDHAADDTAGEEDLGPVGDNAQGHGDEQEKSGSPSA